MSDSLVVFVSPVGVVGGLELKERSKLSSLELSSTSAGSHTGHFHITSQSPRWKAAYCAGVTPQHLMWTQLSHFSQPMARWVVATGWWQDIHGNLIGPRLGSTSSDTTSMIRHREVFGSSSYGNLYRLICGRLQANARDGRLVSWDDSSTCPPKWVGRGVSCWHVSL